MKILLHACCAPCAIFSVLEAKRDNKSVTGFFYNPNIHPHSEYKKRKKGLEEYFGSEGLELFSPEYATRDFFKCVAGRENAPERRCPACWGMRIKETFSFAEKNGFDAFTTTLLGSPYQNHEVIKGICEDVSKGDRVKFHYRDLRKYFKEAHSIARGKGIYCQNYCGCVFSIMEREEARNRKAHA